jgi:hypothetical protein
MVKCEICGEEFKNNKGGNLTIHVKEKHGLSKADYYILTELNGVEPKCECGYCNERPNFQRTRFKGYAIGHDRYEWLEKKYIEQNGHPKCKNPECDNLVSFNRGTPRMYCCHKCSEICQENNWNQEKVKQTVKENYNVDNVFQLEEVKEKSKLTMLKIYGVEHCMFSDEIKNKMYEHNLLVYGTKYPQSLPEFKEKQKRTMIERYGVSHISNEKKERESG